MALPLRRRARRRVHHQLRGGRDRSGHGGGWPVSRLTSERQRNRSAETRARPGRTPMTPQEVADRLEITEQIYRYCRSVDRLDVALGHAVFHPDSYADFSLYKGSGRGWIDYI